MTNVFFSAYPYIILSLGLLSAATVLIYGAVGGIICLIKQPEDAGDPLLRLWSSAFVLGLAYILAICVIAYTKWLLS